MTLPEFLEAQDRREAYINAKLDNLDQAVEELALTMDRIYNNFNS